MHRIRRPDAFRRLLQLAASQVGNLVNQAEYASICGISNTTVRDYLEILEESHVIRRLRPFLGGRRAEITSAPKLFFVDTGLRNHLFGGFGALQGRGDRGAVLENHVCAELCKWCEPLDDLRYWRSRNGAEVDFVLRRGETLMAIEVKACALSRPTVPRALRSFVEAYQPAAAVVVNQGLVEDGMLGEGTRLLFRGVEELTGVLGEVL